VTAVGLKGKVSAAAELYRSRGLLGNPVDLARLVSGRIDPERRVRLRYRAVPFVTRRLDWPGVREVLVDEEYRWAVEGLSVRPAVLDLGANIGCFGLYVLSRRPRARVISVEPSLSTFAVLETNRDLHGSGDWKVVQAAVWREEGEVALVYASASTGHRVGAEGDETVPAVTLGRLIDLVGSVSVDLLKLDIEGAEAVVLHEASSVLARVERLVVEIHSDRIDEEGVAGVLAEAFQHRYRIPGRHSHKPLVLATRTPVDLPRYP
jgi:FkbM family methyltransferase